MGDLRRCGGLWVKEGPKGKFMSGELELEGRGGPKTRLIVTKNKFKKEGERTPDYYIHTPEDDGDRRSAPRDSRQPGDDEEDF